jgi:crotonobetainyl-CoA:carnitine CoA-transferase CaiB-like acyl-CoA transferase
VIAAAQPLAGLCVIEFGHSIAAPFAGHVLGELGARVIKIEQPGGDYARGWGPPFEDGASTVFHAINRGKEAIVADLSKPETRQEIKQLILDQGDVVIQNFKFGSLEKLGFVADDFLGEKPGLLWANLGAYGAQGPLKHLPGYDPLMQAMSGLMSISGEEGRPPVRVSVSIVDMATGLWSVIGILAALQRKVATGIGGIIDTSLYETALSWMTVPIVAYLASGQMQTKTGSANAQIVPYQAFATRDGDLMVAAGNDGLFEKLCVALGQEGLSRNPQFQTNADRVINRVALIDTLTPLFSALSLQEASDKLLAVGVPCGPIQSVDQVVTHPQTLALDMIQSASSGLQLLGLPLSFDRVRPSRSDLAPHLGLELTTPVPTRAGDQNG